MNSPDERLLPSSRPKESDGAFRVVYHGSVTPHYGVELLVDAAVVAGASVPNLRLEIYGNGPERAPVEALVGELGLSESVRVAGHRPEEEVAAGLGDRPEGERTLEATLWGRPRCGRTGVRLADGARIRWCDGEWSVSRSEKPGHPADQRLVGRPCPETFR